MGAMPWGTHGCLFYETTQDLLDTVVPYCKAGLEHHEFCLWSLSASLTEEEARRALQQAVPDLDRHLAERSIAILPYALLLDSGVLGSTIVQKPQLVFKHIEK